MTPRIRIDVAVLNQGWVRQDKRIVADCKKYVRAALAVAQEHLPQKHAFRKSERPVEVSLVLSSDARVRTLNRTYRGKNKPTNVLSFPALDEADFTPGLLILGDVILAFETTRAEALAQNKPFRAHAAHLVVHGVLHLLGYDHMVEREARRMERLERLVLSNLGFADPYAGTVPAQTPRPRSRKR